MSFYEQFELGLGNISIPLPVEHPFVYLVAAFLFGVALCSLGNDRKGNLPLVNPGHLLDVSDQKRITEFKKNSIELLLKGKALYPNQPFRIFTPGGEMVSVPANLIDEVRSHPDVTFPNKGSPLSRYRGFEPFGNNENLPHMINKYITRILGKLTGALSEEAGLALSKTFLDDPEWREIVPIQSILPVVTQVSTRVFMGEEGCRDDRWLQASGAYAEVAFHTVAELQSWPKFLRPYVHWYMPSCNTLRARLDDARNAIQVHIDQRNVMKAAAIAKGEPLPKFEDALEWAAIEDPNHDPAILQILLSLVAIHTTTDLLTEVMMRIAQNPEIVTALREEVIQVLKAEGLKKTALYELKLMDSVVKEAQRMKPILLTPMRRSVTQDFKLSNGTVIRKGQMVVTDSTHMWDSEYYEDPDKFDGYRFLRMRQVPGKENQGQLVSTSAEHLGFGHGQFACPGRFFAANEIKVLLCHLLLKYEWKLAPGPDPKATCNGFFMVGDQSTKFLIRRRKEELDLASLAA